MSAMSHNCNESNCTPSKREAHAERQARIDMAALEGVRPLWKPRTLTPEQDAFLDRQFSAEWMEQNLRFV